MSNITLQKIRKSRPNSIEGRMISIFPNAFHWIDSEATVEVKIEPHKRGRVNYHGTSWRAQGLKGETLNVESTVKVVGRKNLVLLVEKMVA